MTRILIAAAVALGLALPAAAQTPLNDYPDATPVLTDKVWGVDDPAGTWSAKLFEFGSVRDLFQTNFTDLEVDSGTLTADDPWLFEQTWNEGATTFTGLKLDVTDTASASGSKLLDLQRGGITKFSVDKNGDVRVGSTNDANITINGTGRLNLSGGGGNPGVRLAGKALVDQNGVSTVGRIAFLDGVPPGGNDETVLVSDAADTLALRRGTNAQGFKIYHTFTNESNYERLSFVWFNNEALILTQNTGTGSARNLVVGTGKNADLTFRSNNTNRWAVDNTGVFKALSDNAYDVGTAGANRPRDLFLAGALHTQDTGELTIATGAVTATGSYHTVDTEGDAASDDLDTINGCTDGHQLVIQAEHTDRTVVAKDGTGNLRLAGDFSLDSADDTLSLLCAGALSAWVETARSDNGT